MNKRLLLLLLLAWLSVAEDKVRLTHTPALTFGEPINIIVNGQIDIDVEVVPQLRKVQGLSDLQFVEHVIETWRRPDGDAFIENWMPDERLGIGEIFTPERILVQNQQATLVRRWALRGWIGVGEYKVMFLQRILASGESMMSTITIRDCGGRLCQTNRLVEDDMSRSVIALIRSRLTAKK